MRNFFLGLVLLAPLGSLPSAQLSVGKQVQSVLTQAGPVSINEVAGGLQDPWGMAFLPDGRLLVTEKGGALRIAGAGGLSDALPGTPKVWANGQGGLMDVALAPDFASSGFVYLSYAAPGPDGKAATALGRGRLEEERLVDFERLFLQEPWIDGPNHFGNRIVFGEDGSLYLALGERFQFEPAQGLDNHLGKVVRLAADGSIPADNPFADREDAAGEIFSFGHRNIEAAAVDPETGALWVVEMGPLGGDEVNLVRSGRNYGWPLVSWGMHYDGEPIPSPETRPDLADATAVFTPVISPSGMVFYGGDAFPEWRGSAFVGSLSAHALVRLTIQDDAAKEAERIPLPGRIRDVEQGPEGKLWVLATDEKGAGSIWRLAPL